LTRRTYHARRQYPEIFFQLEEGLERLRAWIQSYHFFFRFAVFQWLFAKKMQELLPTVATIDAHFAINARAYALMMAEYLKRYLCRKAEWGRIINRIGSSPKWSKNSSFEMPPIYVSKKYGIT